MKKLLFGLEAELAISGRKGDAGVEASKLVTPFFEIAKRELLHLSGGSTRMFLENGGLLYIDAGSHPEIATPECSTPWQAVAHLRSAELVVADLASIMCEELDLDEVHVNRCNVDYLNAATWGCHESYLAQLPIRHYEKWLVPHLASRVYVGSGGLDPMSPGVRFSLSPRVAHIDVAVSPQSTCSRGIFHTRDEPLSSAYRRIHILVGDNTCSQLSQLLKVGSTSLVVALAEIATDRQPPRLRNPVGAMKRFAHDLNARVLVDMPGGVQKMTSLEIQVHFLELVEACVERRLLPDWAPQICELWRAALKDVGRDSDPVGFDWVLKRKLMNREIERSGFSQSAISAWSDVVEALQPQGVDDKAEPRSGALRVSRVLQLRQDRTTQTDEVVASHGLRWDGLEAFIALRQRLCALDVRFGIVRDGVFDALDRDNMLTGHRVVSDAEIAAAKFKAPPDTRARLRGQWVRRLAKHRKRYLSSWESIQGENRRLDLSDPFATAAEWLPFPAETATGA